MALNLKPLDLEQIVNQCCGKQSELGVFQKYNSYKDYTNICWAQIFLLEYPKENPQGILNIFVAKTCKFL